MACTSWASWKILLGFLLMHGSTGFTDDDTWQHKCRTRQTENTLQHATSQKLQSGVFLFLCGDVFSCVKQQHVNKFSFNCILEIEI
jgi:hypothetical protein